MNEETIYIAGSAYSVEYQYTPASGDGWNEERIDASLEIMFVNGKSFYLIDDDLHEAIWVKLWDTIHYEQL